VYKRTWSNVTEPWAITHREIIEKYTGGKVSQTYSVERVHTVGASVKATAGGKVSASVAIASLEEHVDPEQQVCGSYTNKKAESITYALNKDAAAAGRRPGSTATW
jgi:hypothetical protein